MRTAGEAQPPPEQPAQPRIYRNAYNYGTTQWAAENKPNDRWFDFVEHNRDWKKRAKSKLENETYKQIKRHVGMPLEIEAQNRKGQPVQRRLGYGPGGKELTRIVAGLGRGVRQINGTQTLRGAKEWIARNNKKYWEALDLDITGPNGIPDGIKETIVTDRKGNVRIVNGYALGPSSYAWRKSYYEEYPTKEKQMQVTFGEYKNRNKEISPYLHDGNFVYKYPMPYKARRKISARNMFRQVFFTPTFKQFKDVIPNELNAMTKSQLSTRVFSFVWEMMFLNGAICAARPNTNNDNILTLPQDEYDKWKKSNEVKEIIENWIKTALQKEDRWDATMYYVDCAYLIATCLNNYWNIELPSSFTCFGLTRDQLLNRAEIKSYTQVKENVTPILEQRTAILEEQAKSYTEKVNKRIEDARARYNTNNNAIKFWNTMPMQDPAIRKAAREAGWKYYHQLSSDDALLNTIRQMIEDRNNGMNPNADTDDNFQESSAHTDADDTQTFGGEGNMEHEFHDIVYNQLKREQPTLEHKQIEDIINAATPEQLQAIAARATGPMSPPPVVPH